MSDNMRRVDFSMPYNFFWALDEIKKIHMTFRIRLDEKVDRKLLRDALEETLQIWPILMDGLIRSDENTLSFVENSEPVRVFESDNIIVAGAGAAADRICTFTVSKGNIITFSGLHSFLDGGSALKIIDGTLRRYYAKKYERPDTLEGMPTTQECDLQDNYTIYRFNDRIQNEPYEWKEAFPFPEKVALDQNMAFNDDKDVMISRVMFPAADFIQYCKACGCNPTVMLSVLFAKTLYRLNPEMKLPVNCRNTMDLRKCLGLENSIIGQTHAIDLVIDPDELSNMSMPELCGKLRKEFKEKQDKNYLLSRMHEKSTQKKTIKSFVESETVSVAYFGKVNFGEITPHITDMICYNEECRKIHMFDLNGTMIMDFLFGLATEDYVNEYAKVLREAGIKAYVADVSCAWMPLPKETRIV